MMVKVNVSNNTLAYSLNWDSVDSEKYEVELLTVATELDGSDKIINDFISQNASSKCSLSRQHGIAGHVVLH